MMTNPGATTVTMNGCGALLYGGTHSFHKSMFHMKIRIRLRQENCCESQTHYCFSPLDHMLMVLRPCEKKSAVSSKFVKTNTRSHDL